MACEFKITRQVDFFRFMEAAETAFFRSLGVSIHPSGSDLGWPRVHAECDFKHPLRFEDTVEVRLLVREKREKSLVYTFIFRKLNQQPCIEVARGTLAVACVKRDKKTGKLRGVSIPELIANKIEVAPHSAFNLVV